MSESRGLPVQLSQDGRWQWDGQQWLPAPWTLEARHALLLQQVSVYASRGWFVVSQDQTSAQLRKPKTFSLFWALAWFLVFGVGVCVYLAWYLAKRDQVQFVRVDEYGRLSA